MALLDVVKAAFGSEGWPFFPVEGQAAITARFDLEGGAFDCHVGVDEERGIVVAHARLPVECGQDRLGAMAELVTRLNYGLLIGCLEMDYGDGEVRARHAIDVEGAELTRPLMRNVVAATLGVADTFVGVVRDVGEAGLSPADAVAKMVAGG